MYVRVRHVTEKWLILVVFNELHCMIGHDLTEQGLIGTVTDVGDHVVLLHDGKRRVRPTIRQWIPLRVSKSMCYLRANSVLPIANFCQTFFLSITKLQIAINLKMSKSDLEKLLTFESHGPASFDDFSHT